jgi:hypothetical protein
MLNCKVEVVKPTHLVLKLKNVRRLFGNEETDLRYKTPNMIRYHSRREIKVSDVQEPKQA